MKLVNITRPEYRLVWLFRLGSDEWIWEARAGTNFVVLMFSLLEFIIESVQFLRRAWRRRLNPRTKPCSIVSPTTYVGIPTTNKFLELRFLWVVWWATYKVAGSVFCIIYRLLFLVFLYNITKRKNVLWDFCLWFCFFRIGSETTKRIFMKLLVRNIEFLAVG